MKQALSSVPPCAKGEVDDDALALMLIIDITTATTVVQTTMSTLDLAMTQGTVTAEMVRATFSSATVACIYVIALKRPEILTSYYGLKTATLSEYGHLL